MRAYHFLPLFVLTAVLAGCQQPQSQQPAEPNVVTALGRLQPEGGVINVGATVGDRVDTILVTEGLPVKQNKELARLASYAARDAELTLARAQVEDAEASRKAITEDFDLRLAQLKDQQEQREKLYPVDLQGLKVQRDLREKELQEAKNSWESIRDLASIAPEQKNRARLAYEQARTAFELAQGAVAKAEQTHEFQLKNDQTQRDALEKSKQQALAQVPLASRQAQVKVTAEALKQSSVFAPSEGVILKLILHQGEATGAQPLLRMGNTDKMMVIGEVYETDKDRIAVGQPATISSDALGAALLSQARQGSAQGQGRESMLQELRTLKAQGKEPRLSGTVEWIGQIESRNSVFDINPAAESDRRVFEVRIRLDDKNKNNEIAKNYIEHQVLITFGSTAQASAPPAPTKEAR
jgi:HlyD family secretion protein